MISAIAARTHEPLVLEYLPSNTILKFPPLRRWKEGPLRWPFQEIAPRFLSAAPVKGLFVLKNSLSKAVPGSALAGWTTTGATNGEDGSPHAR